MPPRWITFDNGFERPTFGEVRRVNTTWGHGSIVAILSKISSVRKVQSDLPTTAVGAIK